MASEKRSSTPDLIEELEKNACQYGFFHAIYLLSQQLETESSPGHALNPALEKIWFKPNPSLGFPASDLESISIDESHSKRIEMVINFLCVVGQSSPLPAFYTESLPGVSDNGDTALKFLQVFNHRLHSLYYRSWEKYRISELSSGNGSVTFDKVYESLLGLQKSQTRRSIEFSRLLGVADLMGVKNKSAEVVEKIISHYLGGKPVEILQFVSQTMTIDEGQLGSLGSGKCKLGKNSLLGSRASSRSNKFILQIGPLDFDSYKSLTPGNKNYSALRALVPMLLLEQKDFDIHLLLFSEEIPDIPMNTNNSPQLGWDSWIGKPNNHLSVIRQFN